MQEYNEQVKNCNLSLALVEANFAHHESPEAHDTVALENRLNATVLQHLSPEEAVKRGMVFKAR
jgi:hypothetical protein